jgi:hypothetical protein
MLRVRDLGINFIPVMRRPSEILPDGGVRMAQCQVSHADCNDVSDGNDFECIGCSLATDKRCEDCTHPTHAECNDRTEPDRPGGTRASAFTDDAVAQLRQQLDDRVGQQLSY